jgi:N-acetyl-anhydromuramyl-L-alanine amidase AmpD
MRSTNLRLVPVLLGSVLLVACMRPVVVRTAPAPVPAQTPGQPPRPGDRVPRGDDEIVVCGERFHTGTKVVLWTDPGGYDAYRPHRHFEPDELLPSDGQEIPRYGSFRRGLDADLAARVRRGGWRLEDLRQVVQQVVVHYDAAGTSARCFEILQDRRGLSAHFLLDADGTIYQTLDLKERAWHAGTTNDRSVGIEIANIGAYPDREVVDRWYPEDDEGTRLEIPEGVRRGALADDGVLRPARNGVIAGEIQGRQLFQYDFTPQQYEALAHLLAALSRVLPRCRLEAPRGEDGAVLPAVLPEGEARDGFEGILGHWHVSTAKVDPGPAFDWDRVLARARVLTGLR